MAVLMWVMALWVAFAPPQDATHGSWPRERPTVFVDLAYPLDALAARVAGRVVVSVTTDASGRVVDAASVSGPERLVPAVLANVRQWTLSPGARTGAVVYRFEIDYGSCNDDSHSLFRLVRPNLAVITACTAPGRAWPPPVSGELQLVSTGGAAAYPPIARSARVEGVVVLDLSIDAAGHVVNSRPLTDLPLLTQAAVAHSKTWRVRPSEQRRGIVVYEFALDGRRCDPQDRTEFSEVTAGFWRLSACSPFIDR